jgi:hypothetical protein
MVHAKKEYVMTVTVNELTVAYDLVSANTDKTLSSGFLFEQQKEVVETMTLKAIASGEIQGKNEGERKATALSLFATKYSALAKLEQEYRLNSNALALAKIHLDFVRDCIRIEELAKK